MTAETAPQPEWQERAQGGYQQQVRYGIVLAALAHVPLRDRRFHVAVITGALGVRARRSDQEQPGAPGEARGFLVQQYGRQQGAGPRTPAGSPAPGPRRSDPTGRQAQLGSPYPQVMVHQLSRIDA